MAALTLQRCFNHVAREAAARCPECRQFFCRECITEHEGRVVCAGCLRRLTLAPAVEKGRWGRWRRRALAGAAVLAGVVLAWLVFIAVGELLILLPTEVHDGSVWNQAVDGMLVPRS